MWERLIPIHSGGKALLEYTEGGKRDDRAVDSVRAIAGPCGQCKTWTERRAHAVLQTHSMTPARSRTGRDRLLANAVRGGHHGAAPGLLRQAHRQVGLGQRTWKGVW